MRIALDAMGGDRAPEEVVRGALAAAPDLGAEICLVGLSERVEPLLRENGRCPDNVSFRAATEVIGMTENPVSAIRRKRDASLAVAIQMARDGEVEAVVSAGNTGALMALSKMRLGTIPGVERPAITAPIPTLAKPALLLDAGANSDCKPEHLVQFAVMASQYAADVMGVQRPRVGLLNIGSEDFKGNELTKEAAVALRELEGPGLNFVGFVEGDQAFAGEVDVVVCDGFVGNVVLKVAEGVGDLLMGLLRQEIARSVRGQVGAVLMRPIFQAVKGRVDYREYGGALLLGLNGVCVKSHGRSDAMAIGNALTVAKRSVESGVIEHIRESCARLAPVPDRA
jgi:glycerol-3-phosphate acyltransferase PlsX